jgi:hypothetical protein
VERLFSKVNKGDFIMTRFKFSARLSPILIAASMIAAALIEGAVFGQAVVLGAGLMLVAIVHHPTRCSMRLALFHVACIFLLALIEDSVHSKVLPVWLYGGLVYTFWQQIQGKRRLSCQR